MQLSKEVLERAFFLPRVLCASTSAHWVPTAFLSRLLTGCLSCLAINLLHVVLTLKVSALLASLGDPNVGSSA
jgi:hypothetical protein